jgi:hypothetical protein
MSSLEIMTKIYGNKNQIILFNKIKDQMQEYHMQSWQILHPK